MKEIKCLICSKPIESLEQPIEPQDIDLTMWNGGIVGQITAGYGSIFDEDQFIIGLCDSCIADKIKEDNIIHKSIF